MLNEVLSAVIFLVFTGLLLIGSVSTGVRWVRYIHAGIPRPVLLIRDAILLGGLAWPFVLISIVRAFGLVAVISGDDGPAIWWLLITGIPPIVALAVYVWFELVVIERLPRQ